MMAWSEVTWFYPTEIKAAYYAGTLFREWFNKYPPLSAANPNGHYLFRDRMLLGRDMPHSGPMKGACFFREFFMGMQEVASLPDYSSERLKSTPEEKISKKLVVAASKITTLFTHPNRLVAFLCWYILLCILFLFRRLGGAAFFRNKNGQHNCHSFGWRPDFGGSYGSNNSASQ
jgi:hypothetical protein